MSNLTVTLRNASGANPGSMVLATFVNPDSPALGEYDGGTDVQVHPLRGWGAGAGDVGISSI